MSETLVSLHTHIDVACLERIQPDCPVQVCAFEVHPGERREIHQWGDIGQKVAADPQLLQGREAGKGGGVGDPVSRDVEHGQ